MAGFRRYSVTVGAAVICVVAVCPSTAAAFPLDPIAVLCTGSADGSGGTCGRWTGSSHYKTGAQVRLPVDEVPSWRHGLP